MPIKHIKTLLPTEAGFICDRCGVEYGLFHLQDAIRIEDVGSYNSQYWKDGTHWEFIICEKCSYELFKDFAEITE